MKRILIALALALVAVAPASADQTTFDPVAYNGAMVQYMVLRPVGSDLPVAYDASGAPVPCVPGFYCDDVAVLEVRITSTPNGGPVKVFSTATGSLVGCPAGFDCKPKRSFFGRLIRLFH